MTATHVANRCPFGSCLLQLRVQALVVVALLCDFGCAHLIQIDHDEFRASGWPRPPVPPPIVQLPQHLPAKELTPAELMVDLTNDLTYRILHYHSILNRNNFAFSPTALMSVLIALYEGSSSRSALELRNVLQLPNNRDVIRVGYRDIHRRLRTYFFGSENPLKGLSLNKDNVTITRDYETVLMFYGYDLGMDMVSPTVMPATTSPPPPGAADNDTTTATDMMDTTTSSVVMPAPKDAESTEQAITEATIVSTTVATTEKPTTTTESITTTAAPAEETTTEAPTTIEAAAVPESTTAEATPSDDAETTVAAEAASVEGGNEAAELVSAFVAETDAEPLLRIQKARVSRLPSGKLQAPPSSVIKFNYLPSSRNAATAIRKSRRHRRHLFGHKELDASVFLTLLNPPPSHHHLFPISGPSAGVTSAQLNNDYELDVDPHYLRNGDTKQNYNTDIISHVFYLAHQQIAHTTFKVYNAVLYYKYFDNLKISVLELELDTPEYNLMILLPDAADLVTAAASLRAGPTLRLMRKQLKPRWVQAIIPDFRLHGSMFLTNDLQNMGICDIFEPNRADFRPMTDEKGLYVKHIEQSINVHIRTHPINQLKRNYGAQTQPIQISVNHPFLFFIVDRDLDVAVMAGRVLNPLNVRIQ